MSLFVRGEVTLHSGAVSNFKIECDMFDDEDIATLAMLIAQVVGPFSAAEGVPTGGERLAAALDGYTTSHGPLVIVDDVCTTGASLEEQRAGRDPADVVGVVVFNRGEMPAWCRALFHAHTALRSG